MDPQRYRKRELIELIDRLKGGDPAATAEAIEFTISESRGLWHGRARAKICRNLKNRPLDERTKDRLVETIMRRLRTGEFSEQFKDQLTMAIRFRPQRMQDVAERLSDSPKDYVRRYAAWVLNKISSSGVCVAARLRSDA